VLKQKTEERKELGKTVREETKQNLSSGSLEGLGAKRKDKNDLTENSEKSNSARKSRKTVTADFLQLDKEKLDLAKKQLELDEKKLDNSSFMMSEGIKFMNGMLERFDKAQEQREATNKVFLLELIKALKK